MIKPIVTFLTGIPGTGKSTTAKMLEERCREQGARIHFFNDYPFLIQWATINRGNEDKVRWFLQENGQENFDIVPSAYPEMSKWVAASIAHEIQISEGIDIFVVESARGAGEDGKRDRYDADLFAPFQELLGSSVEYVNVEMVVRDIETVLARMEGRMLVEKNAAPPFVAKKYVSVKEGVQSAFQQAQETEGIFALNEVVDNSGPVDSTRIVAEGIIGQVMALYAREMKSSDVEGRWQTKES